MIFLIPGFIIRSKISPMPKNWSLWKKAIVILEGPLVIVNLLTYSFIPYVDAQTRMMLGKKMKDHYHTPKVRG
jgi:antibiotic biosynthesis monooxygenase (ABM) superfamily enzyme